MALIDIPIKDGQFETPTVAGDRSWKAYAGGSKIGAWTAIAPGGADHLTPGFGKHPKGYQAVDLGIDWAQGGGVEQGGIPVQKGSPATITFDYTQPPWGSSWDRDNTFEAIVFDEATGQSLAGKSITPDRLPNVDATNWQSASLSFTPTGNSIKIQFLSRAGQPNGTNAIITNVIGEQETRTGDERVKVTQKKLAEAYVRPDKRWVYPTFELINTGTTRIGTHQVVFTAPERFRFTEDRLGYATKNHPAERHVMGTVSADGRTLTCPSIPLDLAPGDWAVLYPAMELLDENIHGGVRVGMELGSPVVATGSAIVTIEG